MPQDKKDFKIVFGEDAERTFVGLCPICEEQNGICFYYSKHENSFESFVSRMEDDLHKPFCVNKKCSGYRYTHCYWEEIQIERLGLDK